MAISSLELLDTSIAQLQTLVAFLAEQLDGAERATPETRACKEIARSLCVLIRTCQPEGLRQIVPTTNTKNRCQEQASFPPNAGPAGSGAWSAYTGLKDPFDEATIS